MEQYRLSHHELTWFCDPLQFEFEDTGEIQCLEGTIGQDRALTAIEFGLGIEDAGFNIFILGEPGTGRSSTIKKILHSRAASEEAPDDWCYLNDFNGGTRPTLLRLPAGLGQKLHKDVESLVALLAEEIPKIFECKELEQRKNAIAEEYQERNKRLFEDLEARVNAEGFLLQRSMGGMVLVPTKDGEPLSQKEYEELSGAEKAALDYKGSALQELLNEVLGKVREHENEMRAAALEVEKEIFLCAVGCHLVAVEEKYEQHPGVLEHFESCKKDILERLDEFRPAKGPQIALPGLKMGGGEPSFDRYRINLFIDNGQLEGAPVIYEANPTYFNLFGRIEHIIQMGNAITNFTMIKPGALHRAGGGYLILDCREVLINLFSYEALKRCIRDAEVRIEDMAEQFRLIATVSLKPQPVPLECKIVIIGTPQIYYLLYQLDPDFRKYFKVQADFDRMMKNDRENVQQYAQFVATQCRDEKLLPFSATGVSRVVEFSARLIEDKNHLSSRFIAMADLIREAAFYAAGKAKRCVERAEVEEAVESRIYRSNKLEERIQEYLEDGTILVDTEGEVVGQVNGLSVFLLGDYSFGKPSRVTVRTYLGKVGVVNIEREVKLSGPAHDKGVLILTGFLGDRYARDKPLAMAASICFEQSYSGVEGDSASSTELYGLLSSLSGLPIRQGIAVTGSVNQLGVIQPIGGANEKIEGFYALCKVRGLTGDQGVIIPSRNVKNLLLKEEIVEAVRDGKFNVWGVNSVDEGIEILTGTAAGERREDGSWSDGTVNALVDSRLREMGEAIQKFRKDESN